MCFAKATDTKTLKRNPKLQTLMKKRLQEKDCEKCPERLICNEADLTLNRTPPRNKEA